MGSSSVLDAQVWTDVDDEVRNKTTESFIGELKGGVDIDRITKAYGYKREIKEQLRKMGYKNSYFRVGHEEEPVVLRFSSAGHKEENEVFFERYRKEKKPLKKYTELINNMKSIYKEEENKIRDRIKKQRKIEMEIMEKEKMEKNEKTNLLNKSEERVQKAKEKESESKEKVMKICYEMRNDSMVEDSEKSWRKIGLKLNLNHITVKKYAEEYEEKLKSDIQLNQLEEKMQDQEFVDPDEEVEDENDSED